MKSIQRALVAGIFVVAVAVWVMPARADLLTEFGSLAYTDTSGMTWDGSTPYSDYGATLALTGSVEWLVFWPGTFTSAFPSASASISPTDLVYAYQIVNSGTSPLSTFSVSIPITSSYDAVSAFPLDGGASPTSITSGYSGTPGYNWAYWFFEGGVASGGLSDCLAYESPNVPDGLFGSVVDSGLGDNPNPLPVPSDIPNTEFTPPVPEPSTVILLAAAAILLRIRYACFGIRSRGS